MLCVIIPVYKTKPYKLRLSEASELGLGPRTVGRKATAFGHVHAPLISSGRASWVAVRKMGVLWEKVLAGKPRRELALLLPASPSPGGL